MKTTIAIIILSLLVLAAGCANPRAAGYGNLKMREYHAQLEIIDAWNRVAGYLQ